MNFWTPTFHSWGEGFNPEDMPWYVLYDYVEVFVYNQHMKEFEFHWRDDFNSFDSGRWHKASGGFEANSSIFYPEQVYTNNGNLVIKMEPMEDLFVPQEHPHGLMHGHQIPHYSTIRPYHGEQVADTIYGLSEDEEENELYEEDHLGHETTRVE